MAYIYSHSHTSFTSLLRRATALCCCLLMAISVLAAPQQKKKNNNRKSSQKGWFTKTNDIHSVSFYTGGGYSGLVGKYGAQTFVPQAGRAVSSFDDKFIGGGGGILGVNYELWHKRFIFAIGPEFRLFTSRSNMLYQTDVVRDDYASMTQHYTFNDFREIQTMGQIMLPVMFGGSFDKVYFLAGAKVGYTLISPWKQRGGLTTSVTEDMAVEDWNDILSHQLLTADKLTEHALYNGTARGSNQWGLDATISAEVGININAFLSYDWNAENKKKAHPWHMRAAAFLDYGIPMLRAAQPEVPTDIAAVEPINQLFGANEPGYIATQSMHSSTYANRKLSSLLVGVKFTAVLQLTKPKQPNPRIVFWVTDTLSMPTKSSATIMLKDIAAAPKAKPKVVRTKTSGKAAGTQTKRFKEAEYWMVATANGYLPSNYAGDTLLFEHTKDMDTVHFTLIPNPRLVCYVTDAETDKPLLANIHFLSRTNQNNDALLTTDTLGAGVISLTYGDCFQAIASAEGYFFDSVEVVRLTDTLRLALRPLPKVVEKMIFKHFYFAYDRTEILSTSEDDLLTLYTFLTDHPDKRILITGHTDSSGAEIYNQRLSEGRAASVKNALVERGIDPERIETNGKGESEPIDTNLTEAGRQNNRRVEVSVLEEQPAELPAASSADTPVDGSAAPLAE
ncbi:MAG: OmpA family protein [Paludibacteraceae bacterium]|nr:OmpA family protein [Paludibacteraceae bacterium]